MSSTKHSLLFINEDENCDTSSNEKVEECLLPAGLNLAEEQSIGNSPNIYFEPKISFDANSEMSEELDFEDEPKTEHDSVASANSGLTNCDTGEENLQDEAGNQKLDLKLVNRESEDKQDINIDENSKCDGEILSDDCKSDEVEEGEIVDTNPVDGSLNYSCRFYERGKCSYGNNCRYFHLSDKGLYTMFNSSVTDKICLDNLRQNNHFKPTSNFSFSMLDQYTTPHETAWDRAIFEGKERVKRARDRKDDDDFEEKKLYISNTEETNSSRFIPNDISRRPIVSIRSKANSHFKLQSNGKNYSSTLRNIEPETNKKNVEAKRNQNRNFLLKENYHSDWRDPWRRSKSPKRKEKLKSKSRSPSSSPASCNSRCCSSRSALSDVSSSSLSCRSCSSKSPTPKRRKIVKRMLEHDKWHDRSPSKCSLSSSLSRSATWSESSSRSSSKSKERYHKTRQSNSSRCRSPSVKQNSNDNLTHRVQRKRYRSPSVIRTVTRRKTPNRKKSISPQSDSSSSWSSSSKNLKNVPVKGNSVHKSKTSPLSERKVFDVKQGFKSKDSVVPELKKSSLVEKSQHKSGGQTISTFKKSSEFKKDSNFSRTEITFTKSKETLRTVEAASIKCSPVNTFSTTKKPNIVKQKAQTSTINAEELLRYHSNKNNRGSTKQLPSQGLSKQSDTSTINAEELLKYQSNKNNQESTKRLTSQGISKQADCNTVQSIRQQNAKSKNEQISVIEQNAGTKPKISINILHKDNKEKSIKNCDSNFDDVKPRKVTREIPSRREFLLQQLKAVEEAIARKKVM